MLLIEKFIFWVQDFHIMINWIAEVIQYSVCFLKYFIYSFIIEHIGLAYIRFVMIIIFDEIPFRKA